MQVETRRSFWECFVEKENHISPLTYHELDSRIYYANEDIPANGI